MNNMEYGDFHKFLVSIGVTLVGLAFVIPWLFLKEPFDLMLESNTFSSLTKEAQEILTTRQDLVKVILDIMPIISIILIALGVISVIFGLCMWRGKQAVIDESDRLDLEMKRKEFEPMSTNESIDKANMKLDEQIEEITPVTTKEQTTEAVMEYANNHALKRYFEIEEIIARKIKESYGEKYSIFVNYRINRAEFDIIMQSERPELLDKLIELKYYKQINLGAIIDTVNRVALANQIYVETLERKAVSIILIVTNKEISDRMERYKERANEEISRLGNNTSIRFINENDLNGLTNDFLIQQ